MKRKEEGKTPGSGRGQSELSQLTRDLKTQPGALTGRGKGRIWGLKWGKERHKRDPGLGTRQH